MSCKSNTRVNKLKNYVNLTLRVESASVAQWLAPASAPQSWLCLSGNLRRTLRVGFISTGNGCHTCLMTMRKGRVWWGRQHLKAGEHLWGFDCLGLSCTSGTAEWSQFCKNNVSSVQRTKRLAVKYLAMASKRATLIGIGGSQVASVRPTRSKKL